MSNYSNFLSRLEKVKQRGQGSWIACCPAHSDTTPSLAIDVGKDGRLLLKCWAGCSNLDVISAVGVSWAELYPPEDRHYNSIARRNGIKERTTDDYIVDLANNSKPLSDRQVSEAERAALRGGKEFGFSKMVKREASK